MTGKRNKSGARPPDGAPTARELEFEQNEALWRFEIGKKAHTFYGVRIDDLETPKIIDARYVVAALKVFGRFFEEAILPWAADIIVALGLTDGTPTAVAKRVWAEANHREYMACYWVDREIASGNLKISRRLACERVAAKLGLPGASLKSARASLESRYRDYIEHGLDPVNRFHARTGRRLHLGPLGNNRHHVPADGEIVMDNREWRSAIAAGEVALLRLLPAETVENPSEILTEPSERDTATSKK